MKKPVTPAIALDRLEALCVAAERCESELRQKLWTWQISSAEADRIMDRLIQGRFVDNERFARSFVRDKYRLSLWGRRKIAAALAVKRIDSSIIRTALEEIDQEEYISLLRSVVASKIRSAKDADTYEGRTKIFRSVASRGYEPALIAAAIKDPSLWTSSRP